VRRARARSAQLEQVAESVLLGAQIAGVSRVGVVSSGTRSTTSRPWATSAARLLGLLVSSRSRDTPRQRRIAAAES
jgi:hypothetical protein